jgi:hypothetical protein
MRGSILLFVVAAALSFTACGKETEIPTSPTQPTVADVPPPAPTPAPAPTPPVDDRPIVKITGVVANLSRSGAGDLDISFRIDDFTIVRAKSDVPVSAGSRTGQTDFIRNGQTVTAEGRRTGGFLDATKLSIDAEAPQ